MSRDFSPPPVPGKSRTLKSVSEENDGENTEMEIWMWMIVCTRMTVTLIVMDERDIRQNGSVLTKEYADQHLY